MLPNPDILNEFEGGKFVLSNLAAKRAKRLLEGALPLVQIESKHPLTIALAEIAAGKIKPTYSEEALVAPGIASELDEFVPAEHGVLLPSIDDEEVEQILMDEDFADHDLDEIHEDSDEPVAIADLVSDEDEVVAPADDAELSLSDLEEQETFTEEESEE